MVNSKFKVQSSKISFDPEHKTEGQFKNEASRSSEAFDGELRRIARGFLQIPEGRARLRREVSIRRISTPPTAELRFIPRQQMRSFGRGNSAGCSCIKNYKNNWKLEIGNSPLSGAGFTLIELLIVMSIIGILAAISIFGLAGARESARDGRRKSDLEVTRSAIEIYKADCNQYPGSLPSAGSPLDGPGSCQPPGNRYIEKIPGDPLGGNYFYSSTGGITYILCSTLEDPPSPSNDTSGCGGCAGGPCEYKVINP